MYKRYLCNGTAHRDGPVVQVFPSINAEGAYSIAYPVFEKY